MHQRSWILAVLASFAVGMTVMPRTTLGADLPAVLPLDAVTVYVEGAALTRRGTVAIPAGTHRIIARGLPASLDTSNLRVRVDAADVRIGSVDVEKVVAAELVSDNERMLQNRQESLTDERAAIQDEISTAETQLKLLDSIATQPGGAPAKPAVDAANLGSVLTTMSQGATAARARIRAAKLRQRKLESEIAVVNADLAKIATRRKATHEVRVLVAAAAAIANAPIVLEYRVEDASWEWIYEARLDTRTRKLVIGRQAAVEQGTGEDWRDIELTLTTAEPSDDASTPQLASLLANLEEPMGESKLTGARAGGAASSDESSEIIVTGARRADFVATDFLVEYKVPARTTIEADREPRLYPIAEDTFDAALIARTVPRAKSAAFLEATFKYERTEPLQGGELQLYRDGAFVGTASLAGFLPGADARIAFGVDERLKVRVLKDSEASGSRGLVGRTRVEEERVRFEVTSFHAKPLVLEVLDRVPVPQNDDVRVEILRGATPATQKDVDGKAGILLWRADANPREPVVVKHYYSVQYPRGRVLTLQDDE